MLIRVFLGILLSCVFCAGLAHAQTAEEIADHIQHSYETMRSFDATFVSAFVQENEQHDYSQANSCHD